MRSKAGIILAAAGAAVLFSLVNGLSVSNLSGSCLQCLCWAASNCSTKIAGRGGYEGPFWISRVYWADAGNQTLPYDDPLRDGAYSSCAKYLPCAEVIVVKYMQRYGKDCNKDGVTDCDDYARLHYLGSDCGVKEEFTDSNFGRRYEHCRGIALKANPLLVK